MPNPKARPDLFIIVLLVLLATATRLLPHPPNFVPVGAMALFGAAVLPQRWLAIVLPLAAYYISDLILNNLFFAEYFTGFYWKADPWIYGGVLLMVLFGMGILRGKNPGWGRIGVAAVGATLIFFLLSNLGVWMSGMLYPKTIEGLMTCFLAALPFLGMSLAANLVFCGVLFGAAKYFNLIKASPERETAVA